MEPARKSPNLRDVQRRLDEIERSLRPARGEQRDQGTGPSGRLRTLGLFLTNRCNLACTYCYQNRKTDRSMSSDVLRSSLDLLLATKAPELRVAFFGGEPLLEMQLIREAVGHVSENAPAGVRVQYVLSTNGTLLDREILQFLARHRIFTEISSDGVAEAQAVRGPGTFAVLDDLLLRLRHTEPVFFDRSVGVKMTVGSHNLEHIADSVAYFLTRKVSRISLAPIITHDPDWNEGSFEVLDSQLAKVLAICSVHRRKTGRTPVTNLLPSRPIPRENGRMPMCGVRWGDRAVVDVDGEATACVTFSQTNQELPSDMLGTNLCGLELGSITDQDFDGRLEKFSYSIRSRPLFMDKNLKYSTLRTCRDCRWIASCHVCPAAIGHIPDNRDPHRIPDHLCAWNLLCNRYAEKFQSSPENDDR